MRVKRRNDPRVRAFWSRHVAAWMRSPFNQREYCERYGLSRTLLQKWRIWLSEDRAREERIKIAQCRRRRRLSPMTYDDAGHRTKLEPTDYQQDLAERLVRRRRRFSEDEKRHFLGLANQPGSSLSDVAQRYDLALSLRFGWRKELEGPAPFAGFAPVTVTDDDGSSTPSVDLNGVQPAPAPQEPTGGMEIALKDGKRVRIEAGANPEEVRRLVSLLEGASP
jgi:transposase-like protein